MGNMLKEGRMMYVAAILLYLLYLLAFVFLRSRSDTDG